MYYLTKNPSLLLGVNLNVNQLQIISEQGITQYIDISTPHKRIAQPIFRTPLIFEDH